MTAKSMKRHVFAASLLGAVVALGLACAQVLAAPSAQVRAVVLSADDAGSAIALKLSAKVAYRVTFAKSPNRIALILHHARAAPGLLIPQPAGPVTGLTSQPQANGDLRVTIFLTRPLPVHFTWDVGKSAATLVARLGAGAPPEQAPHTVQAEHAPRESGRDIVIAVDAGHGGVDPGATGHAGVHEKDVVLAIARSLARRINAEPGMRAVLTRDSDVFLTLRDRMHAAHAAKADLFVSIHADSIANSRVSGSSVYILSERGASNEAARSLADLENAADLKGGVSLADKGDRLASVLLDLSQSANISASMSAAHSVIGALQGVGLVRKPQVQQAGFVVLKSPDIPSMLVETAYISNPQEERRLRDQAQQAALADAVFTGLRAYFADNPPEGTRFSLARLPRPPTPPAATGAPGA
jgi:N-acetylmuramoyl-L-alanine amidase